MIHVPKILKLHDDMVVRWHAQEVDHPFTGVLGTICMQHGFNFQLWHQEDIARSPHASDANIATVKRSIDRFNQQRNDWIEKVDDWISGELLEHRIAHRAEADHNTETPGSAIDRLSILSLRIYHLDEQCRRTDASVEHQQSCQNKVSVCRQQRADLAVALQRLLDAIRSGEKRHITYRQLKMYNDPTLNPYLYQSDKKVA